MGRTATILKAEAGEYTEKRSRFIADLFYVETEEDVERAMAAVRKRYYDARHHCTAYILRDPADGRLTMRSSDDGEPQGTAGHPMLDVLSGEGLVNVLAVVTRYFGGTLLGTGGLVRSYTKAVQDAVARSAVVTRQRGVPISFSVPYELSGKAEYLVAQSGTPVLEKTYAEAVFLRLLVPEEEAGQMKERLRDLSGGKIPLTEGETVEYAVFEGQILTGEALTGRNEGFGI